MPAGEAAPPPSAVTIAFSWALEELADCEEFDSSVLTDILRFDPSIVGDPVYGGRTVERLVLKCLEEAADSTETLSLMPLPKSITARPDLGPRVLEQGISVTPSSESVLYQKLEKVGGLNSIQNCIEESCRNDLRQVILHKRAALPRSSLDLLKDLILEDCYEGTSFPSKLSCLVRGDQRNSMHTDKAGDHEMASQKLNLDNSNTQQVKLLSAISSKSNQNLHLKEATSTHECQLSKQNVGIGMDDGNACSAKQNIAPELPVEKNKKPQSSSQMETGNGVQFPSISPDGVQKVLSESSSDDEGYYDAAPDFHPNDEVLAAEKLKLLNSQNPVNNDSQTSNWTQQRSCIKCEEGGLVLICTGSGCPIAVHENCLGLSVDIENPEDFKCPFCSYLLAASAYNEARKKFYEARKQFSVARKTLSSFLGGGQEGLKKVPPPTLMRESRRARKPSKGSLPGKVCVNQRSEIRELPERQNQAKSTTDENNGNLHAGKGHPPTHGILEPSDGPRRVEHAQGLEYQQQAGNDSDTTSLPCQEIHVECEKMRQLDPAAKHDVDQQSSKIHSGEDTSSSRKRKCQISSRHSKRYKNPMFPYARRKVLPWTCEEEAILKEGMEKFYPSGEENISWVKIWEFGQHIFHKTRQPADLKDKWRNIRKREG